MPGPKGMKRITLLLAVVLAPHCRALGDCPSNFLEIEQSMEREMRAKQVPGAAIAITCGGKVIYSRGFGVTSVETPVAVTADTLFRLGSTAKVFTALAAVRLGESGKVELDVPVSKYLPELPRRLGPVTLRQLLTHTSGLRDEAPQFGSPDENALAAMVRSFTDELVMAQPGQIFSYSNLGYIMAGRVLEAATGKPFATTVEETVLRPMEMKRSTYRPLVALTYPLALGHASSATGPVVVRPFADHAGAWPPGSLFSSANEMARLLLFLAQAGMEPLVEMPGAGSKYGFGLMFREQGGKKMVGHTGSRTGYSSVVWAVPAESLGVAILGNRTGAMLSQTAAFVLGLRPGDGAAAAPPALEMTADEMAAYAGRYLNKPPLEVELMVRENKLLAQFQGRSLAVEKVGEGKFRVPGGGQLSSFRLLPGADGKIEFLAVEAWAMRKER